MRDKLIEIRYNGFYISPKDDLNGVVQKAADYLIAHGVTVQEWIPVSERLPKESGYYLVHHKGGFVSERYFYEDAPEIFAQVRNDPVTHWMPLPEAPKEVV